MIRPATRGDVDGLVAIENEAFTTDRLTRERFLHLLTRGNAVTLVHEAPPGVLGAYAILLFRSGFSVARLYSIAVRDSHRRRGLGRDLLHACEEAALDHDCLSLRLEVSEHNRAARGLYEREGFRRIGKVPDYYEDGQAAVRFEKLLVPHRPANLAPVPYYAQTLDFTCGAACLLMAMRRFDPAIPATREVELDLWREATLIFMTSGVGGCGAFGLGVAALRRGFAAEIRQSADRVPFLRTVRHREKKEVIRISHMQFRTRAQKLGARIRFGPFGLKEVAAAVDRGWVPIVLVSGYRLYGEKIPHWVVVTGYDDRFVYVHDPIIPDGTCDADSIHLPIRRKDFARIRGFGGRMEHSMVAVGPREPGAATRSLRGGSDVESA